MYMINDILDTHLIANEKFGLAFESLSLAECLESVVQLNILQARKIDIEIKLVNNLPTDLRMCSDVNRLRQILMNLVAKSLKFTEKDAITLSADYSQCLETDENPIKFIISVSDTGCGISLEDQKQLFTDYSVINKKTTRGLNRRGIGLGLVISDILVRA